MDEILLNNIDFKNTPSGTLITLESALELLLSQLEDEFKSSKIIIKICNDGRAIGGEQVVIGMTALGYIKEQGFHFIHKKIQSPKNVIPINIYSGGETIEELKKANGNHYEKLKEIEEKGFFFFL